VTADATAQRINQSIHVTCFIYRVATYSLNMSKKAIQLDTRDNVATVTDDVAKGEPVEVISPDGEIILEARPVEAIIFGHKLSLEGLSRGDKIIKYGEVIGVASKPIAVGGWVHTHNVESGRLPTSELEAEK